MASSFERGAQPSTRLAFSLVAFFALPSSRQDLTYCRIAQRGQAHQPIGELPGRNSSGRRAHAALEHLGDVEHRHEIAGDSEEAFAFGGRMESWRGGAGRRRRARRRCRNRAAGSRAWRRQSDAERGGSRLNSRAPSTGPNTPTGLTTESSRPPPSLAMKSQAARSAKVFDFT